MSDENASEPKTARPSWLLPAAVTAALAVLATLGVLFWGGWLGKSETSTQAMVHDMGAHVMPFDLDQTQHIFQMTETGGVQQVIALDPANSEQVALIQQHLQHETIMFQAGDFSDPTSLHGEDMPGVQELSAGVSNITIQYRPLPDGGQITFETNDPALITALHRWFGAQLSDHREDATYK